MCSCLYFAFETAVVLVLESPLANVTEDVGEVPVCVRVEEPTIPCSINFPFYINIYVTEGTYIHRLIMKRDATTRDDEKRVICVHHCL